MKPRTFEHRLNLTPKQAYTLLGVAKSAWYDYRSTQNKLPRYIQRSINVHYLAYKAGLLKLDRGE